MGNWPELNLGPKPNQSAPSTLQLSHCNPVLVGETVTYLAGSYQSTPNTISTPCVTRATGGCIKQKLLWQLENGRPAAEECKSNMIVFISFFFGGYCGVILIIYGAIASLSCILEYDIWDVIRFWPVFIWCISISLQIVRFSSLITFTDSRRSAVRVMWFEDVLSDRPDIVICVSENVMLIIQMAFVRKVQKVLIFI